MADCKEAPSRLGLPEAQAVLGHGQDGEDQIPRLRKLGGSLFFSSFGDRWRGPEPVMAMLKPKLDTNKLFQTDSKQQELLRQGYAPHGVS